MQVNQHRTLDTVTEVTFTELSDIELEQVSGGIPTPERFHHWLQKNFPEVVKKYTEIP